MPVRRFAFPLLAVFLAPAANSALAGEIRGRLVLDQKPAAGISVFAVPYESPLETARRQARASTKADRRARRRHRRPRCRCGNTRDLRRPRGRRCAAARSTAAFDVAETVDLGEHVLAAGEALAGTVRHPAGQPVAGAEITLLATTPGDRGSGRGAGPEDTGWTAPSAWTVRREAGGRNAVLRIEMNGYASFGRVPHQGGRPLAPGRPRPRCDRLGNPEAATREERRGSRRPFRGASRDPLGRSRPGRNLHDPDAPAGKGRLVADAGEAGFGEVTGLILPLPEGKSVIVAARASRLARGACRGREDPPGGPAREGERRPGRTPADGPLRPGWPVRPRVRPAGGVELRGRRAAIRPLPEERRDRPGRGENAGRPARSRRHAGRTRDGRERAAR